MNTDNFESFNRMALHVLVTLFENFPSPCNLTAFDVAVESSPDNPDNSVLISTDDWDRTPVARDTITWLRDEGFITVRAETYGDEFLGVRLTLKGLTLVGYEAPKVEGADGYRSFAEWGRDALSKGSRFMATEVIRELLKSGFARAIGSGSGVC